MRGLTKNIYLRGMFVKGLGLVLAGGGGKGAYQIGVWKALEEYGVSRNVSAVSGTSVGALNAALFVQRDFEKAENVWLNISSDKMLKLNRDQMKSQIVSSLSNLTSLHSIEAAALTSVFFTKKYNQGLFSRDGLIRIMDESVCFDQIKYSDVPCFASCLEIPALKVKYFQVSGINESKAKSVLLATSALPVIYEPESIDGKTYIDGGVPTFGDNVPLKPLYDIGIRNFLVVHLNRESVIDNELYPDARILQIVPRENQGDLIEGTLDFSRDGARRRIQQGYNDAVSILEPLFNMGMVQGETLNKLEQFRADETTFYEKRVEAINRRDDIKDDLSRLADAWRKKDYGK